MALVLLFNAAVGLLWTVILAGESISYFSKAIVGVVVDLCASVSLYLIHPFGQQLNTRRVSSLLLSSLTLLKATTPKTTENLDEQNSLPTNYMRFHKGKRHKAEKAWKATRQWRQDEGISAMLSEPRPLIGEVKAEYPFFLHGHTKEGYPVIYERTGQVDPQKLFGERQLRTKDIMDNYVYFLEFLSSVLTQNKAIKELQHAPASELHRDTWGLMYVMDVKGVNASHVTGEMLQCRLRALHVHSAHYPHNLKRMLLINTPSWVSRMFWMLRGNSLGFDFDFRSESQYLAELREHIEMDQIPKEFGGSSPYALGEHPYDIQFSSFAKTGLGRQSCKILSPRRTETSPRDDSRPSPAPRRFLGHLLPHRKLR